MSRFNEFYDINGNLITVAEFNAQLADTAYRTVGSTEIGPYWVSTVLLGLNHNFTQEGPPIIFETMVFSKAQKEDEDDDGLTDMDCVRYSTLEEAKKGHEDMCTLVRATLEEAPWESEKGAKNLQK